MKAKDYHLAVQHWVFFTRNYPYDFIEKAFPVHLVDHLKSKFRMFYADVGPSGVMETFYLGLDAENREILAGWVQENYKGIKETVKVD